MQRDTFYENINETMVWSGSLKSSVLVLPASNETVASDPSFPNPACGHLPVMSLSAKGQAHRGFLKLTWENAYIEAFRQ